MIRYQLDDLGWFHFEALTQSILKAELGMAVESWGGHSDLGRDAYSEHPLMFPVPGKLRDGPFLFQAKFVQAANASGAKPAQAILKAVSAEVIEIQKRIQTGEWSYVRHFVLLTNAPLSSTTHASIKKLLKPVLPKTKITALGGKDICDLLDKHPSLRRSFPEIMSLRDLDALLSEVVNKAVLERSKSAIEETRDVVPVFVPTDAYYESWRILQNHGFVVLDGPPEMGKTAIARMIALGQISNDWQAIDCRNPDDFFASFDPNSSQIFVADDAFGRTEYDVTQGRKWERDLPKLLHRIDNKHWLIWTSRKHILIRALYDMDLTGKAINFPAPGEVIVSADNLSIEEKARILYRHARAANLEEWLRRIVRNHASQIVKDEHFTPERIRRFIQERLPALEEEGKIQYLSDKYIADEVTEAIRNPTLRMKKAFKKLPIVHKYILIALLDCNDSTDTETVKDRFIQFQPSVSQSAFTEALDDLTGTFVKLVYESYSGNRHKRVDWIHPSYRDLVIDELSNELIFQNNFLKAASIVGIKLALSEAGGSTGARTLPLMSSKESWHTLKDRLLEIVRKQNWGTVDEIIEVVIGALSIIDIDESYRTNLLLILRALCDSAYDRCEQPNETFPPHFLYTYFKAASLLDPLPPLPNIVSSLDKVSTDLNLLFEESSDWGKKLDPQIINDWLALAAIVRNFKITAADQAAIQHTLEQDFQSLLSSIDNEVPDEIDPGESERTCHSEADRLISIASSLERFPTATNEEEQALNKVFATLHDKADEYCSLADSYRWSDSDDDVERGSSTYSFSTEDLFSDL